MSDADGFLSRWAKRKADVRSGRAAGQTTDVSAPPAPPAPVLPAATALAPMAGCVPDGAMLPTEPERPSTSAPASPDAVAAPAVREAEPLPTMEDVALLTQGSDYSRFMQRGVEPGVRNAAMKKLFSDPHFNVMDGLDTYIDDYGKADPIPASMLRRMTQSKLLGLFEADARDTTTSEGAPVLANPDGTPVPAVAQSFQHEACDGPRPASEARPDDDDADLRLQQDNAAGRPGPATGSGA
jgi:hypothetical protein